MPTLERFIPILVSSVSAIIISVLVYKSLIKKYFNKRTTLINDRLEIISSLPIRLKLDKIGTIAKHNREYQNAYESWNKKYEKLAHQELPLIKRNLDEITGAIRTNHYQDARVAIATLLKRIEIYEVEMNRLLKNIEELTAVDSMQRLEINKYKDSFRQLKAVYHKNRIQMETVSAYVEEDINNIEIALAAFDDLLARGVYEKTTEIIKHISNALIHFAKTVDTVPQIVTYTEQIIPKKGNEVLELRKTAKAKKVNLQHISILDNLHQVDRQLNIVETIMKTKNFLEAEQHVNQIMEVLSKMEEEIILEISSKEKYDQIYSKVMDGVSRLLEHYIRVKADIKITYSSYIVSESDKDATLMLHSKMEKLSNSKNQFDADSMNILEPLSFSQLVKRLEVLSNVATQATDILNKQIKILEEKSESSKKADAQYASMNRVLVEIKSMIGKAGIPEVETEYAGIMQTAQTKLYELKSVMTEVPLNGVRLKEYLSDSRDHIWKLQDIIRSVIENKKLAERLIVWANRYRASLPIAETLISSAEISFKTGDFDASIEKSLELINKAEPSFGRKLSKAIKDGTTDEIE